jgi:hypothetical protein
VARTLAFAHATTADASAALARLAVFQLPADTWERAGADLTGVSPQRLEAAAKTLSIGRESIVVFGDLRKLEGPVRDVCRELGLTPEVIPAPPKPAKK